MIEKTKRWTKESIIGRIQELHAQGVQMSNKGIQQEDKYVFEAAKYHFKSVRNAIKAAGYQYQNAQQYWSAERAIATIQAAHADGVPMRLHALEKYAPGLPGACSAYFNSSTAAIIAAGFEPGWKPKTSVLRPRKTIVATPVIPHSIRYNPFEQEFDQRRKGQGAVLNRITSPLSMSEAQRTRGEL